MARAYSLFSDMGQDSLWSVGTIWKRLSALTLSGVFISDLQALNFWQFLHCLIWNGGIGRYIHSLFSNLVLALCVPAHVLATGPRNDSINWCITCSGFLCSTVLLVYVWLRFEEVSSLAMNHRVKINFRTLCLFSFPSEFVSLVI